MNSKQEIDDEESPLTNTNPPKGIFSFFKKKKDNDEDKSSDKWRSSAQEELKNFKGVPVVGGLPWKTQYYVLASILIVCVLSLIYFARGETKTVNLDDFQESISHMPLAITTGSISEKNIALKVSPPQQASAVVKESWEKFKEAAQQWEQNQSKIDSVGFQAKKILPDLDASLKMVSSSWKDIIAEGADVSKEGVLLAQLEGNLSTLYQTTQFIADGGSIPSNYNDQIVSINRVFEEVRGSPIFSTQSSISTSWRSVSSSWGRILNSVKSISTPENLSAYQNKDQLNKNWFKAGSDLNIALINSETKSKGTLPTVLSILTVVVLLLMMWVSFKQHHWQVLNERAINESNEEVMLSLIHDFNAVADGDFSRHIRINDEKMSTLGDVFNSMMEKIRSNLNESKSLNRALISACDEASEIINNFIDLNNHRISLLGNNVAKMITVGSLSGEVKNDFNVLVDQTSQINEVVADVLTRVEDLIESAESVQIRQEEAKGRIQRLGSSNQEVSRKAYGMKELAELFHIVAIQAGVQAAKSGESGGFKVIAETLTNLSKDAKLISEQILSLSETTTADLEALSSSNIDGKSVLSNTITSLETFYHTQDGIRDRLKLISNTNQNSSDKILGLNEVSSELENLARDELNKQAEIEDKVEKAAKISSTIVEGARATQASLAKLRG